MQDQEAREGLEGDDAEASMRQSGFTGRRGRKRKELVGAKIKTEDDSRLLMNSFSQVPTSNLSRFLFRLVAF